VIGAGSSNLARSTRRTNRLEEDSIDISELLPFARNVILVIDRFNRTDWLAGSAIHALIRLDVEHPGTLINAIDRALLDTRLILDIHTRLSDYVGHFNPFK
jgi:hypothetical protein